MFSKPINRTRNRTYAKKKAKNKLVDTQDDVYEDEEEDYDSAEDDYRPLLINPEKGLKKKDLAKQKADEVQKCLENKQAYTAICKSGSSILNEKNEVEIVFIFLH